jgi:hypothetical protein
MLCGMNGLPQPANDRRRTPRQRALLTGKLHSGETALESVSCTIRNTSETSVLVELPSAIVLSAPLHLVIVKDGKIRAARAIWQKGKQLALELGDVRDPRLDDCPDLRRIGEVRDQLGLRLGSEVLHIDAVKSAR